MGLAIIVPDLDFSNQNLGKVTIVNNIPLEGISIVAPDTFQGESFIASIAFLPSNTAERSIVWSITSGGEYATINADTGEVTVLSNADNSEVTIKAASSSDPSIYNEKTIFVTYSTTTIVFHNIEQSMIRDGYVIDNNGGRWYIAPSIVAATRQIVVIPIPEGATSFYINNLTADVVGSANFIENQDINLGETTYAIAHYDYGTTIGIQAGIPIPPNAKAVVSFNKIGDNYFFETVKQYGFV